MSRSIGSVVLDDGVNSYISEVNVPSVRNIQFEQIVNRQGRMSRVKEDQKPLIVDVRGTFVDGGGVYWRDWKAALLGQSRADFVLGDGTCFKFAEVVELSDTQTAAVAALTATPQVLRAWTMKVQCYEPYVREIAPTVQTLGNLTTGNGTFTTSFNVAYSGTAFAEPTWQINLTVPSGVTVTGVSIYNAVTGEFCNVQGNPALLNAQGNPILLGYLNIPQYVLIDASGAGIGPIIPTPILPTPNNSVYGLLSGFTVGYGVTIGNANDSADWPFTGQVPSLVPNPAPSVPPVAYTQRIDVAVAATAALTSANLQVLAPKRYYR
jgi:hypothetical protein